MEENTGQDIEKQLIEELDRFRKAIDSIKKTESFIVDNQQIIESIQTKNNELFSIHNDLKIDINKKIIELESNFQSLKEELNSNTQDNKIEVVDKLNNDLTAIDAKVQKVSKDFYLVIDNLKRELKNINESKFTTDFNNYKSYVSKQISVLEDRTIKINSLIESKVNTYDSYNAKFKKNFYFFLIIILTLFSINILFQIF